MQRVNRKSFLLEAFSHQIGKLFWRNATILCSKLPQRVRPFLRARIFAAWSLHRIFAALITPNKSPKGGGGGERGTTRPRRLSCERVAGPLMKSKVYCFLNGPQSGKFSNGTVCIVAHFTLNKNEWYCHWEAEPRTPIQTLFMKHCQQVPASLENTEKQMKANEWQFATNDASAMAARTVCAFRAITIFAISKYKKQRTLKYTGQTALVWKNRQLWTCRCHIRHTYGKSKNSYRFADGQWIALCWAFQRYNYKLFI